MCCAEHMFCLGYSSASTSHRLGRHFEDAPTENYRFVNLSVSKIINILLIDSNNEPGLSIYVDSIRLRF